MKIIQAQEQHLEEILQINKVYDYGNPNIFIEESILKWKVLIALVWDKVVGFLLYQYIWWNTLFLALVKVLPYYQWQWIGSELISSFEESGKQRGDKKYLSSTEEKNIQSQKFHQKLWFKKIGTLDMPHGREVFFIKEI